MNAVSLIGNLGRPAEVRAAAGSRVANFSLAVTEKWVAANGDKKENTSWVRCVAWGYLADEIASAQKGDSVFIAGSLAVRSYDDKEGKKREVTEVKAQTLVVLPRHQRQEAPDVRAQAPVFAPAPPQPTSQRPDDDIPF